MRLLIITQSVDERDPVLGFMLGWIAEFAKRCESVTVIGLSVGHYDLPENVRVFSLGKEQRGTLKNAKGFPFVFFRLKYLWNFFQIIIRERRAYDAVFVHMNPEYVILGGPLWKIMGKRVGLWYAHGHTSAMLKLAVRAVDLIFTSTESGFRISSSKKRVVGQGIDTEQFRFCERHWDSAAPFRLVVIGRLSPVKDIETFLRAVAILHKEGKNIFVDIVGGSPLTEQNSYAKRLQQLATELDINALVKFHGAILNTEVRRFLAHANCFVNTSRTGSFDKAVGEAMATGLPVLTSNEAFKSVLESETIEYLFPPGDSKKLTALVGGLMAKTDEERNMLGKDLRERIIKNHDLKNFTSKILAEYHKR